MKKEELEELIWVFMKEGCNHQCKESVLWCECSFILYTLGSPGREFCEDVCIWKRCFWERPWLLVYPTYRGGTLLWELSLRVHHGGSIRL